MARAPLALLVAAALLAGCSINQVTDRVSRPGSSARDLVSAEAFPTLVVELDHPPGYAPNAEALAAFKTALQEASGRLADRVQILQEASIPAEAGRSYSFAEIEALEREHRSRHTGGDTAVLYMMYVAGGSDADTADGKVLGAAYRGTSLVIFKGNIKDSTGGGALSGKPEERFVERAVLIHEFGHAAGLVNLGTEMVTPHEDPDHPGHSNNKESVMYWAVENTGGLFDLLGCVAGISCGANIPWKFDENDKADLKALREK